MNVTDLCLIIPLIVGLVVTLANTVFSNLHSSAHGNHDVDKSILFITFFGVAMLNIALFLASLRGNMDKDVAVSSNLFILAALLQVSFIKTSWDWSLLSGDTDLPSSEHQIHSWIPEDEKPSCLHRRNQRRPLDPGHPYSRRPPALNHRSQKWNWLLWPIWVGWRPKSVKRMEKIFHAHKHLFQVGGDLEGISASYRLLPVPQRPSPWGSLSSSTVLDLCSALPTPLLHRFFYLFDIYGNVILTHVVPCMEFLL